MWPPSPALAALLADLLLALHVGVVAFVVLGEMGIKAEWEHNRAGLVKKAVLAGAVVGTAVYLMRRRER